MRLIEILRTLILLLIMLHIYGVATATELFSATFAEIFISLLWPALKAKNINKEQFVPVSVLFF